MSVSLVWLGVVAAPAAAALPTRTWVSGVGDDANPCSRVSPCKTFSGALSKTEPGGEIAVLDSGNFGVVTINKSITIDATGALGGVTASVLNGIYIDAGPSDRVILRGLAITGSYAHSAPCAPNAVNGVRIRKAGSVRIEASSISNTTNSAVSVEPTASTPQVVIDRTDIRNSCGAGVSVAPAPGQAASVVVTNSTISNAGTAVSAATGGSVLVTNSALFANNAAVATTGSGSIDMASTTNQVIANTATGTPTQTSANGTGLEANRTWISGVGDDANPCTRTAPCKTLEGAFHNTATGGTINAIDPGSFGSLNVTRAVTVDLTGVEGGVAGAATDGVTVDVGSNEDVVLRGLDILGGPSGLGCATGMDLGINIRRARSVHVEDSRISNFIADGVLVNNSAGSVRVKILRTDIRNGCGPAVSVSPGAGATADVLFRDGTISHSPTGIKARSGGHAWVAGSVLAYTGLALSPTDGLIDTFHGTNTFIGNTSDGTPSNVLNNPEPTPTVTVTQQVPVPVEVGVPVEVQVPGPVTPAAVIAQRPLGCSGAFPKKVKKSRSYTLLARTCWTNAENNISVTIAGAGKAVRGKGGKVKLRTKSGHGTVTVTFSAPATTTHSAYAQARTYKF